MWGGLLQAFANMSMKEMKEKLRTMGVDFSGCLEKSELKALLVKSTQGEPCLRAAVQGR